MSSLTLPLRRDILTVANRRLLLPGEQNGRSSIAGLGLQMKPLHLFQSPISRHSRLFSHRSTLLSKQPQRSQDPQLQQPPPVGKGTRDNTSANPNPQLPSFSLSSLGLSKNMRIFVITLFLIFGSVETWVWCQAIWHWWKGSSDEGKGSGASSAS